MNLFTIVGEMRIWEWPEAVYLAYEVILDEYEKFIREGNKIGVRTIKQ